jgi:hypothetical protein
VIPTFPIQSSDTSDVYDLPQRDLTHILTAAVIVLIVGIAGLYMYCQRKIEEDQNPEYTRAILGDDAFEFSKMEAL